MVNTFFANDTVSVYDVAIDAAGNKYIADNRANCIRKVTPNGVASILAGGGPPTRFTHDGPEVDGPGSLALFGSPVALAVDASGNIYVADAGYNRIRKITPDGFVSTIGASGAPTSGHNAGFVDGAFQNARFNLPFGIAVDA